MEAEIKKMQWPGQVTGDQNILIGNSVYIIL